MQRSERLAVHLECKERFLRQSLGQWEAARQCWFAAVGSFVAAMMTGVDRVRRYAAMPQNIGKTNAGPLEAGNSTPRPLQPVSLGFERRPAISGAFEDS